MKRKEKLLQIKVLFVAFVVCVISLFGNEIIKVDACFVNLNIQKR